MNNLTPEIFYGPYFLPWVSIIFLVSGIYSLVTQKVLIPPKRGIDPKWMSPKWAIVWGTLQILAAVLFIAIYFQKNTIYQP